MNGTATLFGLCHSTTDLDSASNVMRTIVPCSGTGVNDYAESYPTNSDVDYGDVVILGDEKITVNAGDGYGNIEAGRDFEITKLKKSTGAYQNGIIGVVSKNYTDFSSLGKNDIPSQHHPMPIALSGRVPVKVSIENGPINTGDNLTTSSTPGVAMKATKPGRTIGRALANYSAAGVGQVMVFVEPGLYDPDVYITDSGNISVAVDPQTELGIVTNNGENVNRISAFAESFIGNLFAGFIEADKVTTDSLVVNTGDVTINGKSLDQYIADIAGSGSASATIDVGQINNFDQEVQARIDQALLNYGTFTVQTSSTSAQILAQLVAQSQAQGTTPDRVLTTDVLLAGFEIVTPKLTANEINVGTLRADKIEGLDILVGNLNVAQISDLRSRLDQLMLEASGSAQIATTSAEETPEQRIARLLTEDATASATPTNVLTLGSIDVAGIATVSGDLKVKGNSIVEGILTVIDTLNVGDVLITGVSNFLGESIFGDRVTFQDQVKFSSDTAGAVILGQGQTTVNVTFTNAFDTVPQVTATLKAEGTAAQKQAVLSAGYDYAITDVTTTGFTIQLNKAALSSIKFSWVAIQTN